MTQNYSLGGNYTVQEPDTGTFIAAMQYYYNHPYEFVVDVIGVTPSDQQKQVLDAFGRGDKHVTVRSGHGIGKTALESWVALWFMSTRPHARIPCTAPTQNQLYDILWSELKKWINQIKDERIKNMFEWTQTHLRNKRNPETWFATARSSSKPENLQGFHADELLFIIDEASGVDEEIMEVIQGALTNEGALCLTCGNPTKISGFFYDSHHADRGNWTTFHFSSIDSPFVSDDYADRMKSKYGEDSNIYKVRVLGDFPTEEDDSIISLSWAEQAAINSFDEDPTQTIYIGVDVARYGDDKTYICVRQGNTALSLDKYAKQSTMETVGYVMLKINEFKARNKIVVNVDDTGVGGGVTDRLIELTTVDQVTVNGINNGSKARNPERFVNLGTEMWWNMRENIRNWSIPNNSDLIGELTTRKYRAKSTGKIELERKDEMKKRGLNSPDSADALALAFLDNIEGGSVIIW